jgi:phosphatidylserine/phosphatidylglycerophosphate/cardiolipin synthase-like enzyme
MASVSNSKGRFSVIAYEGDAKTLLAFNLDEASTKNLAGFTIECAPHGQPPYYLHNQLQFDQGLKPFMGRYTYTVTPRYFDGKKSLLPLDPSLSVSVDTDVLPFVKGNLRLGFARGFMQSQAFVHHFGKNALIRPMTKDLLFDTSQLSGANARGDKYTFAEEYEWLGFTARARIFELLNEVLEDASLHLDMFAYDLNEPDLMKIVLELAKQGRVRVILDNAALHHDAKGSKAEDQFENEFRKVKKGAAAILRGKFGRYAHNKVLVVSNVQGPLKVLTGSTNFSVTGIYVNSNHVLVFDEKEVAEVYAEAFAESWSNNVGKASFQASALARGTFASTVHSIPPTKITFSPHSAADAAKVLDGVAKRIAVEGAKKTGGSVLFAVMEIDKGTSPVYEALNDIHQNESIFSFGISDSPKGICLYKPGTKTGLLVSGKPASTVLPRPFDQVPGVGLGHQVHHKFVVCGFNQPDAVVYCGSSNLANGGEEANGDNLLAIYDADVATVFAIEALGLVDHFNFLDKCATGGKGSRAAQKKGGRMKKPSASPQHAAVSRGWFISTDDQWAKPYFDPKDLKFADRTLFG